MRRVTKRTIGLVVTAGIVMGAGITVTELTAASGTQAPSTSTPCTSATYALGIEAGSGWSISATGQVSFGADAATASVTLPSSLPIAALAGATLQADLVGGTVYVAVPGALSGFVGGAPWVSIGLPAKMDATVDGVLTHLADWCGSAPSMVAAFAAHGGRTSSLGSSTVDGVPVTGTQVDQTGSAIAQVLALPPGLVRGAQILGTGDTSIDVWVDSQGRLVRVSVGDLVSVTVTNIDQPVSITAPTGAVPLPAGMLGMLGSF